MRTSLLSSEPIRPSDALRSVLVTLFDSEEWCNRDEWSMKSTIQNEVRPSSMPLQRKQRYWCCTHLLSWTDLCFVYPFVLTLRWLGRLRSLFPDLAGNNLLANQRMRRGNPSGSKSHGCESHRIAHSLLRSESDWHKWMELVHHARWSFGTWWSCRID